MLKHLYVSCGNLDFYDSTDLRAKHHALWASEILVVYFNQIDVAVKKLKLEDITFDKNQLQDITLHGVKDSGKFDLALHDWDKKATADKIYDNLKKFLFEEYAKVHKKNELTTKSTGFRSASVMQ